MIPAFLLKNPLASVVGAGAVVLAIGLGVQTLRLSWADEALGGEKLAFSNYKREAAEASLKLARDNEAKSAVQAQRLADDFISIMTTATDVKAAIHAAQTSGACERDPKWRATVRGVQSILDGGAPAPARKAPAD